MTSVLTNIFSNLIDLLLALIWPAQIPKVNWLIVLGINYFMNALLALLQQSFIYTPCFDLLVEQ